MARGMFGRKTTAKLLVAGGAGYVGSSVVAYLLDQGHEVWVLDDLSTGHRSLVPDEVYLSGRFIEARVGDREVVEPLLAKEKFDAVFHFAAKSIVGESVRFPEVYRENNVEQTRILLDTMLAAGTNRFVFSSTAAIFGDPGMRPIDENLEKKPINPYGETKLEVEQMLGRYVSKGLRSIALRYFNAAGADSKNRVGENHEPETHLIPNLLGAALSKHAISVFGTDYETRDGTCVRDYVHVEDLAQAHEAAFLRTGEKNEGSFEAFNLGSEKGFTVQEVISEAERVTGLKISKKLEPRRPGDATQLIAVSTLAKKELEFKPRANSLSDILKTAFAWEKKKHEPKKAIFLDRDGTLNFDPGYINDPEKFEMIPGVAEALKKLQDMGYLLIVVSNQSGVGRGMIRPIDLRRVHAKLDRELAAHGVRIFHYALCFHRPEENCECRKPKPKLVLDTARRYSIDLSRSYMVGDKALDIECGRAAGLRESYLVGTGNGLVEKDQISGADRIFFQTIQAVADFLASEAKR